MSGARCSSARVVALALVVLTGCSSEPPPVTAPAAPAPAPPLEATPPPAASSVTTAAIVDEPPSELKSLKAQILGTFVQVYGGEYKDLAEDAARRGEGRRDGVYRDRLDRAQRAAEDTTLEVTVSTLVWRVKGKVIHDVDYAIPREGPTDLEIAITPRPQNMHTRYLLVRVDFLDDDTFEIDDPFEKNRKRALRLIFKRRP